MKKDKIIYYLAVIFILLFSLAPIIWCLIISMTPDSEMLKMDSHFLPSQLILDNYRRIFDATSSEHQTTFTGLKNSLKIAVNTLIIGIPISVVTGYTLARFEFRCKKLFVNLLLLTIVIPVFTTIIPVYSIFRNMELLDSMFWTSIIYVSSFLPLNTWIVMNYVREISEDIWSAASIDGCNERQTFFKIMLPLSRPIIITIVLIMFIMAWKQYIIPMILISFYEFKPLTLVLSEFMTRYAIDYGMISAVGIISILPPAIVAIVFRRFLISGLTSGAVK